MNHIPEVTFNDQAAIEPGINSTIPSWTFIVHLSFAFYCIPVCSRAQTKLPNQTVFTRQDCSMRIWDRRQAQGCCACHWLGVPALSLAWEPSAQVLMAVGECCWYSQVHFHDAGVLWSGRCLASLFLIRYRVVIYHQVAIGRVMLLLTHGKGYMGSYVPCTCARTCSAALEGHIGPLSPVTL